MFQVLYSTSIRVHCVKCTHTHSNECSLHNVGCGRRETLKQNVRVIVVPVRRVCSGKLWCACDVRMCMCCGSCAVAERPREGRGVPRVARLAVRVPAAVVLDAAAGAPQRGQPRAARRPARRARAPAPAHRRGALPPPDARPVRRLPSASFSSLGSPPRTRAHSTPRLVSRLRALGTQ